MLEHAKQKTTKEKLDYIWYKDSKILGLVLLALSVTLYVTALLRTPIISVVHNYTVGMVFGNWFSIVFYGYVAFLGIDLILERSLKSPKFFNMNRYSYWFYVYVLIMLVTATGWYQYLNGWTTLGSESWGVFVNWFKGFTSSTDASQPGSVLDGVVVGGLLSAFTYASVAWAFSGIGALIFTVILLTLAISKLITGSTIGIFRIEKTYKKIQRSSEERLGKIETNMSRLNIDIDENEFKDDDNTIPSYDEQQNMIERTDEIIIKEIEAINQRKNKNPFVRKQVEAIEPVTKEEILNFDDDVLTPTKLIKKMDEKQQKSKPKTKFVAEEDIDPFDDPFNEE